MNTTISTAEARRNFTDIVNKAAYRLSPSLAPSATFFLSQPHCHQSLFRMRNSSCLFPFFVDSRLHLT